MTRAGAAWMVKDKRGRSALTDPVKLRRHALIAAIMFDDEYPNDSPHYVVPMKRGKGRKSRC